MMIDPTSVITVWTIIVTKPLSGVDWAVNFFLTFPIASFFVPGYIRALLIKTVACTKVYIVGAVCCIKQLLFWKRLTTGTTTRPPTNNASSRQPLAIVTGGTSGIGLALCELLAANWRLIIIGRDRREGHLAVERIKQKCGRQCRIIFYSVDLSSRQSINEFLEIFLKSFDRLHLLVNNAAVMMTPYSPVGSSGDIDRQWALNFLAPVYLADRFGPCLQRAAAKDGFSRVVNVTSAVLYAASLSPEYFASAGGGCGSSDGGHRRYSSHLAYANSKLALSMYTQERAIRRRDSDAAANVVTACSVHPGVAATRLYHSTNFLVRWFMSGRFPFTLGRLILTPDDAANNVLWACVSPDVESGAFYDNGVRYPLPSVSEAVKHAMWKHLEGQDIVTTTKAIGNAESTSDK